MRDAQIAQAREIGRLAGKLESIESLLHQLLILQAGAPSSSPTPANAAAEEEESLLAQMQRYRRWASVAITIGRVTLGVLPYLMMFGAALWKWLLPRLSQLL